LEWSKCKFKKKNIPFQNRLSLLVRSKDKFRYLILSSKSAKRWTSEKCADMSFSYFSCVGTFRAIKAVFATCENFLLFLLLPFFFFYMSIICATLDTLLNFFAIVVYPDLLAMTKGSWFLGHFVTFKGYLCEWIGIHPHSSFMIIATYTFILFLWAMYFITRRMKQRGEALNVNMNDITGFGNFELLLLLVEMGFDTLQMSLNMMVMVFVMVMYLGIAVVSSFFGTMSPDIFEEAFRQVNASQPL
jgi:hypothetical protein